MLLVAKFFLWFTLFVTSFVFILFSDFYNKLNENSKTVCYQEFVANDLESIKKLRSIIGKRVYAEFDNPDDEDSNWKLVVE